MSLKIIERLPPEERSPCFKSKPERLDYGVLLDSDFATVVTAFHANAVVNMPCAAVGADCQCRHRSFVVCAAFCRTGLGLTSFRMCHCCFIVLLLFFLLSSFVRLATPLPRRASEPVFKAH